MIVHSLEMKNDIFYPKEDNEKLLGLEIPYYNIIGAPLNLANYTWSDIAFLVNLQDIVLHQLSDIGIKSIMYYNNMGLYYFKRSKS